MISGQSALLLGHPTAIVSRSTARVLSLFVSSRTCAILVVLELRLEYSSWMEISSPSMALAGHGVIRESASANGICFPGTYFTVIQHTCKTWWCNVQVLLFNWFQWFVIGFDQDTATEHIVMEPFEPENNSQHFTLNIWVPIFSFSQGFACKGHRSLFLE